MHGRRLVPRLVAAAMLIIAVSACGGERQEWVLPDMAAVTAWYGVGTEASIDGNVLEIRAIADPDHLARGGRIWARSGPYFYLFNVHVQQLLRDYPDLAGVRARTFTTGGEEVAAAMITRPGLSETRWAEALARASLAQRHGTSNPRLIERLIQFGEDHATDFRYLPPATR
jgi:hypothetical protein